MSPDLDFKVDRRDKKDEYLAMQQAAMEREETKMAREELKKVIMKQRITLEKNTRLYKEMKSRLRHDSVPNGPAYQPI